MAVQISVRVWFSYIASGVNFLILPHYTQMAVQISARVCFFRNSRRCKFLDVVDFHLLGGANLVNRIVFCTAQAV